MCIFIFLTPNVSNYNWKKYIYKPSTVAYIYNQPFERQRQEDGKFQASLGYLRLYLKKKKKDLQLSWGKTKDSHELVHSSLYNMPTNQLLFGVSEGTDRHLSEDQHLLRLFLNR